jgi:leucine dehydrogenase
MFSHPDYDGHEALLFAQDTASGLRALIAIHDTALGPAFGGCRMYPYASEQHAMSDVLRLSRGMTYKAAICELPYGGGKSVIIADPRRDKTRALLHAMGRIIEGLGGRYIAADDVGTTLADLVIMREVSRYTAAATAAAQQALPVTAFGVFEALRAAAEVCLGRSDLEGLRVAVQGLGNQPSGIKSGSWTLRWREPDSNHRSRRFWARAGSILPVRFVADSLLEGNGFEPSVPRRARTADSATLV